MKQNINQSSSIDATYPLDSNVLNASSTYPLNASTKSALETNISITKAGFVGIIGRTNAGKSSLLNLLVGEHLALISHKANATRSLMNLIVPYITNKNVRCQMIFTDTPGLHKGEKLLNQYMREVAIRTMRNCDVCVFLVSALDDVSVYEEFYATYHKQIPTAHILVLNKIDLLSKQQLLRVLECYRRYSAQFGALVPISVKKSLNITALLEQIANMLPESSALFDEETLTTHTMRHIAKDMVLQSIFHHVSDELPYESDVIITKYASQASLKHAHSKQALLAMQKHNTPHKITHIHAQIYVAKPSQKKILIGRNGATIRRIGIHAREHIEQIVGGRVFLGLWVIVDKEWAKHKKSLQRFGYNLA